MRPSISSMTASIIGCVAVGAERARHVPTQCPSHGFRAGAEAVLSVRVPISGFTTRISVDLLDALEDSSDRPLRCHQADAGLSRPGAVAPGRVSVRLA